MEGFKYMFYKFTGSVYIPNELHKCSEEMVLHISDTPISFYDSLSTLLKKINPKYIIHTGDIVDNIKLGLSPSLLPKYRKDAKKLINILESSSAKYIYITAGNHDHLETLENLCMNSIIIPKSDIINIEGRDFNVCHFSREVLKNPCDYNLFGHDLSIGTNLIDGKMFLNGISNIHVILPASGRVFYLYYPFGTDDMRLKRSKIGL